MKRPAGTAAKLALALLSAGATLGVLEAFLRLHPVNDVDVGDNPYQYTRFLGDVRFGIPLHSYREVYPLQFDHSNYYSKTQGEVEYRFNQFGGRWIASAEQPLPGKGVLVVGDSLTFGFGLRYEDAFVFRLEQSLGGRYHFLNFAEPGGDARRSAGVYRMVRDRALHDVVLYGLHLNDLVEFDTSYVANHRQRVRSLGGLGGRSRLADFVLERIARAEGRAESIAALTDPGVVRRPYWTENMAAIEEMDRESAERGQRLVVVILPILVDVGKGTFEGVYAAVRAALDARRIRRIDLTRSAPAADDRDLWILPFDQHPNERANEAFAVALGAVWERHVRD